MKNSLKKKPQLPTVENGEIGIIRKILLGEYIEQYDSSIKSLREIIENNDQNSNVQLKKMENSFNQRFSELERNTTEWFDAYEKSMNNRMDRLEKMIEKRINEVGSKMESDMTEERENLSDMLSTLSKTILSKK